MMQRRNNAKSDLLWSLFALSAEHSRLVVVPLQHLVYLGFGVEERSADCGIGHDSLIPIVLQGAVGDVEMGHYLLGSQIAFARQERSDLGDQFVRRLRGEAHGFEQLFVVYHIAREDAAVLDHHFIVHSYPQLVVKFLSSNVRTSSGL